MAISDLAGAARVDDLRDALALSVEAGWNQTGDDWAFFRTHGAVFGVAAEGRLVATSAALPYAGFGFVAMVLTTPAHRGRGHAAGLLDAAVQELTTSDLVPVLDATPAGRPVYERRGFLPVFGLERWVGTGAGSRPGSSAASAADLAAFASADAAAFGAPRGFLIDALAARRDSRTIVRGDAFALARRGRVAMQVGPLVAPDEATAIACLVDMLDGLAGAVVLDVPVRWQRLAGFLEAHGFTRQRPFTRMALGRAAPFGDPSRLFATAGPEFG